jgi:NitT/TauT family transport system substrate-binding protein
MKRSTFTLVTAAAAAGAAAPARAQALTTFRFGTAAVESYALGMYAQEAGFFKKQGLDAQITYFNGGGAVLTALIGGSLDYGCVNLGATSNAFVKGIPVAVFAGGGLYTSESPTTILAVGKDNAAIKTGKDLNGKTAGVSTLKDLQQAAIMKWVDSTGGDSSTLKFAEMPIPQVPAALNAGRIDVGIVLEPVLTSVKSDIRVIAKCYDAIAKKLMISAHLGLRDYLQRNAATTRKIQAALTETAAWANANHDKAGEILTRVAKIPVATISAMARTEYTEKLEVATIQPVLDASAQYKFLERPVKATDLYWSGR